MSFVNANDHPNPDRPEDPLYYAPRSVRNTADPRSSATPQTRADHLPPASSVSRFDEMREEAFTKFTRPLESQFAYERRPRRVLLATVSGIAAAIGVTVIAAVVLFNVLPKSKTDPSELAVSISTPASATPAEVTSENSQTLLQGFTRFQKVEGSENPERAVSERSSVGTGGEGAEKPQALLEKFIHWQPGK
jgi:hypothetical protein